MNSRKKIYDTHTIYKKDIVIIKEAKCPIKLEYCIRAMLYEYRIKNRKDFYECPESVIKKAFKICSESLDCMNQQGGTLLTSIISNYRTQVNKIDTKITNMNNNIYN